MATGDRCNFSGDINVAAPTGGVTRGLIYLITDVYCVARETASATVNAAFVMQGNVTVTKNAATGKSFAIGDKVYVDASTKKATPNATSNTLVGVAISVAAATDTTVDIYLPGIHPTAS